MATAAKKTPKYRLKLRRLDFISAVDQPAQETAGVRLIKRAGVDGEIELDGQVRVVKVDDELGLVFGWAFTSKAKGEDYVDLHDDNVVEDDVVKVAAEFMEQARAMDVMHDGVADGRIVFAMPMTSEVAKAFDIETDTTGLMIAAKPSADVLAKFKDGTYTGFSIAGLGERTPVEKADRVSKRGQLTAATDGHAHLYDDSVDSGHTSYESSSPHSGGHSHPYVIVDGVVTIGESHGHTHDVRGAAEKRAPVPTTPPAPAPTAKNAPKENAMNPEQILKALAEMTAAELAHYQALPEAEREGYLAKAASERAAIAKAAADADPPVYTTADGRVIRKSQDPTGLLVETLKQADEARAIAKAEREKREQVELEKRAETVLKHLPGTVQVRAALLKAVDGIADEVVRKAAHEALVAGDNAMADFGVRKSVGGGGASGSGPRAELEQLVAKRAKETGETPAKARVWLLANDDTARDLYEQAQAESGAN